jgi:hypothetical protein
MVVEHWRLGVGGYLKQKTLDKAMPSFSTSDGGCKGRAVRTKLLKHLPARVLFFEIFQPQKGAA